MRTRSRDVPGPGQGGAPGEFPRAWWPRASGAPSRRREKLKASWSNWEGLPEQSKLWEHVRATKVNKDDVTSNVGNAEQALEQAAKRLSATYNFAIHTHGSMGPSALLRNSRMTSSPAGPPARRPMICA